MISMNDSARSRSDWRRSPRKPGTFDVIGIGASAGGLGALTQIVSGLPADLAAAVIVVQHLDRKHRSLIADILARHSNLPTKEADASDVLTPGTLLIAPPNKHLLVNPDGSPSLTMTELVNFVRPSIDLLFESIAASFQQRR